METEKRVAIIKCSASCENRDPQNHYDGVRSCAIEAALYQGESDCIYGCLGCGDCVKACPFGAMTINTGMPSRRWTEKNAQVAGNVSKPVPADFASLSRHIMTDLLSGWPVPIKTAAHSDEGMWRGMHRLHEMPESMPHPGSGNRIIPCPYRSIQMHVVRRMRQSMSPSFHS